ncbi:UNVERIFIED_CONTAM: hypothetical protein HHA_242820 [Hammondia hammondi]|eukprot:XP_008884395.1 hypothetical protein HHA_242820 [Hammondia hammondi]
MRSFLVFLVALAWQIIGEDFPPNQTPVVLSCSAVRLFKAAQIVSGILDASSAAQHLGTPVVQLAGNQPSHDHQEAGAKTKGGEDDDDDEEEGSGRKTAANVVRAVGNVATTVASGFGLGGLVGGATNMIANAVAGNKKPKESDDDDDEEEDHSRSKKKGKKDDDDDDDADDDGNDDDDEGKKSKKKKKKDDADDDGDDSDE